MEQPKMDGAVRKLKIMLDKVSALRDELSQIEGELRDLLIIAKNWRFVAREMNGFPNVEDAPDEQP